MGEFTQLILKEGILRPKGGTPEYQKWWNYKNRERIKAVRKLNYLNGGKERQQKYYLDNKDRIDNKNRQWQKDNPTRNSEYMKMLRKTRPGYIKTRERLNCLKRKQRFVFKHLLSQIEDFYSKVPEKMVIDHIVPLQGKNVSGLHVPWNFQYLTVSENNFKRNNFDGTYNNESWKLKYKGNKNV